MASHEKLVQAKDQPGNKIIKQKVLQNEDDQKLHDESQIRPLSFYPDEKDENEFRTDNMFEPGLMSSDNMDEKNDNDFEVAPTYSDTPASGLRLYDDESISEDDAEDDYLIEIPLQEQVVSLEEGNRHEFEKELLDLLPESVLQQEGPVEFLSDINYEISGEENLIEIDISMGSIRHSGCEIRT